MQKIEFVKHRDFGELVSVAFKYIARNFRTIAKIFLLFCVPLVLLTGVIMLYFKDDLSSMALMRGNSSMVSLAISYGSYMLVYFIASILLVLGLYSHIQIYRETASTKIEFSVVLARMRDNLLPVGGAMLFTMLVFLVPVVFCVGMSILVESIGLAILSLFLLFLLFMYLLMPLQFLPYVMLEEKLDLSTALRRCFSLISGLQWLYTFGLFMLVFIICSMVSRVFVFPAYIAMMIGMITSIDVGQFSETTGIWVPIIYMLTFTGTLFSYIYYYITIPFKYHAVREEIENVTLRARIAAIGERETQIFENEGEF